MPKWLPSVRRHRGKNGNKVTQGDILRITNASASNLEEPGSAPSNRLVTFAAVTPSTGEVPPARRTAEASSSIAIEVPVVQLALPGTDAQATQDEADQIAKEPQPETGSAAQTTPAPSLSQRLWNEAYEHIESGEDTSKLAKAYMQILMTVLTTEKAPATSFAKASNVSPRLKSRTEREGMMMRMTKAYMTKTLTTIFKADKASEDSASGASDLSTILKELKDPIKRQEHMKGLVEGGQAKLSTATASKILDGVGSAAQFIISTTEPISAAIGKLPQAALPWAGVCIGLQILLQPKKAAESICKGISHVVERMDWYCALIEHALNKDTIVVGSKSIELIQLQLESRILGLYKACLLYQMKSVCSFYRNQATTVLRSVLNVDDWDGELKSVIDAESILRQDLKQCHNMHGQSAIDQLVKFGGKQQLQLEDINQHLQEMKKMHLDDEDKECIRGLGIIDPQEEMDKIESNKDELLEDAYDWILHTDEYVAFTSWSNDRSELSPCRLLWIKGHAGTGKTMLLIGIIRKLSNQLAVTAPNLSSFFCQGTDTASNNATSILRCLIWQLLVQQPYFISHLREKYKSRGSALFCAFWNLKEAFVKMLKDPRLSRTYFIIDALDECEQKLPGKAGRAELFELIATSLTLTEKVKWLVSSRPEVNVHIELRNMDASRTLVELDPQRLEDPVKTYIEHKISKLDGKAGYNAEVLAEVSTKIREKANNIFLWVALVFKTLESVNGFYAAEIIENIPPGLAELYDHMMKRIEGGWIKDQQFCKNVLVATSLAYRPLSLAELAVVAGLPPKMDPQGIVEKCGSFLIEREKTVYLIHQSAKDYLLGNDKFKGQEGVTVHGHVDISRLSIAAMSGLKKNIYALPHPGTRIGEILAPEPDPLARLRYSCTFWIDHLCDAISQSSEFSNQLFDDGPVFAFLKEHFLHWLESLSLLRKFSDRILSIKRLLGIAQTTSNVSLQFSRLVRDAERFALSYRPIIEQAPLQIYGSALTFCPRNSEVKKQHWAERQKSIKTVTETMDDWDPCLLTLEGHSRSVMAIAFLPDGKTLASASGDKTVRLWDAATGVHRETLRGHSGQVTRIVLSPDAKMLASASYDMTVRLWDTVKGAHQQTLEGHSDAVSSLAFSPDGEMLASASDDKTVRLWDTATGAHRHTLKGHIGDVMALPFSPDSKMLASASYYDTVRLWDTATGVHQQKLEGHRDGVTSLAFSPDGKILASASYDWTIRLWDTATRTHQQTLDGHSDVAIAITFSPDGKMLASASYDKTVRLWDTATGAHKQTLEGHISAVSAVAFSPDSKILASASDDTTVRLWDAAARAHRHTFAGHKMHIVCVDFSPDGKMLASASDDGTVRLWDAATATLRQIFEGHTSRVTAIAFPQDSKMLASASCDNTVRLWDTATGAHKQTLEGHINMVSAVAFSPDSKILASASWDKTVQLWDTATGAYQQTLGGHQSALSGIAFSSDGKKLASASEDGSVQLWDAAAGTHRGYLYVAEIFHKLSFSDDDQFLKTDKGKLSLESGWLDADIEQGSVQTPLSVRNEWITCHGQDTLWLPLDYRPSCFASRGNILAVGCGSGRLMHFEYAPS